MLTYRTRKSVVYLHHTRDRDGDLIFYFTDAQHIADGTFLQSSPLVGIRRSWSAVLDHQGRGNLGKYILATRNTEYEVQMPHDKAAHLALELGVALPAPSV